MAEQYPFSNEPETQAPVPEETNPGGLFRFWMRLTHLGISEQALRIGTGLVTILFLVLVVWVMNTFYIHGLAAAAITPTPTKQLTAQPTLIPTTDPNNTQVEVSSPAIARLALLHTNLPTHPRFDIMQYEIKAGDTIFGIAENFGLQPETILWGNQFILGDDPHNLKPGIKINILPANGVLYRWNASDGLNGVAKYFGVSPDAILDWPGNHLDKNTIGDFAAPNIPAGTNLFIPGGTREFVNWSNPRISRTDPAVAKVLGPGYCGTIIEGPVGTGTFVWPTTARYLSGYDYSPSTNHYGIDIGGALGNAVYAADTGVVVYAGWNNWGYGNVIVIDHGYNGWQSLYAHLSAINVSCGSYVYQGDTIGLMGSTGNSTGPHLHFELRMGATRVDPKDFLK